MIYPYNVNHNGKFYPTGSDVPIETQTKMDLDVEEKVAEEEPKDIIADVKKKSTRKAK